METINVPDFRLAFCARILLSSAFIAGGGYVVWLVRWLAMISRTVRYRKGLYCSIGSGSPKRIELYPAEPLPIGPVQEGLVLLDWQRLPKKDRIISGGTGQFHNGKEHDIYVFIVILILRDQA